MTKKSKLLSLLTLIFLIKIKIIAEELPPGFPEIKIHKNTNPSPGYMVFNTFQFGNPLANYNVITDNSASVVKYHKPLPAGFDFKLQPNGLFSYAMPIALGSKYQQGPFLVQNFYVAFVLLDSNFKMVDQIQMKNGYLADLHEFVIQPNGHYLMMAYHEIPFDMSKYVEGGDPNAVVVTTILQELDKDKNCIFEWSSLNHLDLFDTYDDLQKKSIEHAHGNSIFIDTDGNMILSNATTNDIIKIDMVSGEVLWRLGGKKNQFKFINEREENAPLYFSLQHDAHKIDNGNLLFFDNGFMRQNKYSRAVEYKIDEDKKEVELVWEYRSNPDIFAVAMGSARRQKNGNTLINWGLMASQYQRNFTEVDTNGNIVFETSFPQGVFSYRVYKHDYPFCTPVADVNKYELRAGNTYIFSEKDKNTGLKLKVNSLDAFIYNIVNAKKYECAPQNPDFDGEAPELLPLRWVITGNQVTAITGDLTIDGSTLMKIMTPLNYSIYYRETEGSGKFKKLTTTYDNLKNTYTATINGFGEIVLGLERTITKLLPPHPLMPFDKYKISKGLPINLKWNPSSRYEKFRVQIAKDENMQSILLDTIIIRNTSFVNKILDAGKYHWRVKTIYRNVESEWSEVFTYEIGDPFMKMTIPNGGERYSIDSTFIIRWDSNIADTVRVSLYDGDKLVAVIKDSLRSYFNAYKWTIPTSIPPGNNYKIKVELLKNSQFFAISEMPFSIFDPKSISNDFDKFNFALKNFPNPATNNITFELNIEKTNYYTLIINDVLGRKVACLQDGQLEPGNYSYSMDLNGLAKGIYFYEFRMGQFVKSGKFIVE